MRTGSLEAIARCAVVSAILRGSISVDGCGAYIPSPFARSGEGIDPLFPPNRVVVLLFFCFMVMPLNVRNITQMQVMLQAL